MKRISFLLPLFLLSAALLHAQESNIGFGVYVPRRDQPCLPEAQRREIQAEIARNRAVLKLPKRSQQVVKLAWPLQAAPTVTDYGYHGVSNFVDLDPAFPSQLLDYNCGRGSYDLPEGYNHQGTDYFLSPFIWNKMDENAVTIVAAAEGVIVFKQDGQFDRNCGFGSGTWNAVYVEHGDGSIAWYGHMKNNSLTPKGVGERVVAGEYLGLVGSSGNSSGPHLHFELYDGNGNLVDPYAGPCNQTTATSWWIEQRPYYDTAINALMTHSAPPEFKGCPNPDVTNATNSFLPGQTIYFVIYYRDQVNTETSYFKVTRPDGSTFLQWNHTSPDPFYVASYWYWYHALPADAPHGMWEFTAEYAGVTHRHRFTVGAAAPRLSAVRNHAAFEGRAYQLQVRALGNPAPAFSLLASPPGMAINAETGEITWSPDDPDNGNHFVQVHASNALGSDSLAFNVSVTPVNDAPAAFALLTPADRDTLTSLRAPLRFSWEASHDVDDDTLIYSLIITGAGGADTAITTINTTFIDFDGSEFLKPGRSYAWQVAASDGKIATRNIRSFRFTVSPTVGVAENAAAVPRAFRLYPNHPNPFNPETKITYDLPERAAVALTIHDLLGKPVKLLVRGTQSPGKHVVTWEGRNERGEAVPSGIYVYRLQAGEHSSAGRLLLLR